MKALTKTEIKIEGDKVTITGVLVDFTPHPIQAQRVTQMHHVSTDPRKPRHIQQGTEGLMIKRHGAEGFCFPRDEMVAIALEFDRKLTDPPLMHIRLDHKLSPVFKSEIPVTMKWHESPDDGKTWTEVEKPSGLPGTAVKAIATNACGSTESNIHFFPKPKPPPQPAPVNPS